MEYTWNSQNFEAEVLQSDQPVLVDFWATWCGPCRMLAPTLELLASRYEGRVKVGKVNVDEHPDLAARYEISSIPAVLLFQNGTVKERLIGFRPIEHFETVLDESLS